MIMTRRPPSKPLKEIAEPALVGAYRNAISLICRPGFIAVSKKQYPLFLKRQRQLDDAGFTYDRYAYTVIRTWWPWCNGKMHMKVVSVNIFCGNKAWEGFLKDMGSSVRLNTAAEEDISKLVHEEMTAVVYHLGSQLSGVMSSISLVRQSLGYADPPLDKVVGEVMDLLNQLYEIEAADYDQLLNQLLIRRVAIRTIGERIAIANDAD